MNPLEGRKPMMTALGELFVPDSYTEHKCTRPFASEQCIAILVDVLETERRAFMFVNMTVPITIEILCCPWCAARLSGSQEKRICEGCGE